MSIRGGGTSINLQRTAGGFYSTSVFSACFWMKLTSDRNVSSGAWGLYIVSSDYHLYYNASGDGTTFRWEQSGGNFCGTRNLTVGKWYFIGHTRNGTGAGNTIGYSRSEDETTLTSDNSNFNTAGFTPTSEAALVNGLSVGGTGWMDGSICGLKQWNVIRTAQEMLRESLYWDPVQTDGLQQWQPMDIGTPDMFRRDMGPFRTRHFFTSGALAATKEDPPIKWYRGRSFYFPPMQRKRGKVPAAAETITMDKWYQETKREIPRKVAVLSY